MLAKYGRMVRLCPITALLMQSAWVAASTNNEVPVRVGILFNEGILHDDSYRLAHKAVSKPKSDRNTSNVTIQLLWTRVDFTQGLSKYSAVEDFLPDGIGAIISVLKCNQTRLVDKIAQIKSIPHISASLRDCGSRGGIALPTVLNSAVTAELLLTVVEVSPFETIGLIFDHRVDSRQRNRMMFTLSSVGMFSTPAVWNSGAISTEEFREVLQQMPAGIVIMAEWNSVRAIISQVALLNMTSHQHAWVIVTDNISTEEASLLVGASFSANLLLVQPHKLPCSCCSEDIRQSLCGDFHSSMISSRLVEAVCLLHRVFKQTSSACVGPMCSPKEIVLQKIFERKATFEIKEIRRFPQTSVNVIGRWTKAVGLEMKDGKSLFSDIVDFGGRRLIIATDPKSPPFVRKSVGDTEFTGLAIDILSYIAEDLNFTYEFVVSPDGFYGVPLDNGSWTGMIGMVLRGEADMAIGPFTVTHQRAAVIDFATPFMQQSVGILTPTPAKSPKLFQFLKPFSLLVWTNTAAFIVLTGFCLFAMNYSTYLSSRKAIPNPRPKEIRLMENMELVFSSIFGQGPTYHPTVLSARCLLGVWLLFTELLLSMYTAHLAAVLTVATPLKPIDSLEDLDSRDDMTILVESGTSTWTLFEQSNLELYRSINAKKKPVEKSEIGIDAVKKGGHCFIGGRVALLFGVSESCGEIRVAEEQFFSSSYAFVLPKLSPYKKAINFRILKLVEYGIVKSLKDQWFKTVTECPEKDEDTDFDRLSMKTLGGVFVVYGFVAVLGVIILIVENIKVRLDLKRFAPPCCHG